MDFSVDYWQVYIQSIVWGRMRSISCQSHLFLWMPILLPNGKCPRWTSLGPGTFKVFGDDSIELPDQSNNHTYYYASQLVVCSPFPFCPDRVFNHGPSPCSGRQPKTGDMGDGDDLRQVIFGTVRGHCSGSSGAQA